MLIGWRYLTTSFFSEKDFLDKARPPPIKKKIGQNWFKLVKKIWVFSDKDFFGLAATRPKLKQDSFFTPPCLKHPFAPTLLQRAEQELAPFSPKKVQVLHASSKFHPYNKILRQSPKFTILDRMHWIWSKKFVSPFHLYRYSESQVHDDADSRRPENVKKIWLLSVLQKRIFAFFPVRLPKKSNALLCSQFRCHRPST